MEKFDINKTPNKEVIDRLEKIAKILNEKIITPLTEIVKEMEGESDGKTNVDPK